MADLPTGTVTFIFTDVEGSTRLWEQHPEAMRHALARHDAIIETGVEQHGGVLVRPRGEGDSRFAVFARATDAVAAAAAIQQTLHAEAWPAETPLRARAALHTGEADLRDGDYYGAAVNRCARLRAVAHGGQALLTDVTASLVRQSLPAGASLRDLGEHRLADLIHPERAFQLIAPGLPVSFPPLRSLDALPNNLPLQLTSFVGRERELVDLKQALAATRLLTLTGTGGCGKTRLALQVAADVLEGYPEGVWLVELAPLADPALLPHSIATALGVREAPGQPIVDTILGSLHSKRLLILLDNCEHLLDACAHLADALLRRCPGVQLLATSREALGIAGEVPRRVPSLELPDSRHGSPLEELGRCDAVHLFVDRARTVQPAFTLTEQHAPAVVQVCRRLDGIPLAIELAAARLTALTVEQVAVRLDQRFRLLTGGSRTALPRQQTLRAAIDWSYDLLGEQERLLFHRLAVFAAGFTLEAAEAVCSGVGIARDEVLDLLVRLVDRSLVVAEEGGAGAERYRLLETLRQYAREQLVASGEAATVPSRHAAYYLALAEQAEPALRGPEQAAWFELLEVEHDNLRAALGWCLEDEGGVTGGDAAGVDVALRLAGAIWLFWFVRVHRREGRAWLERALARSQDGPAAARAKALLGAGFLAWQEGGTGPEQAQSLVEASVAEYRRAGDRSGTAFALGSLGIFLRTRGDYARGTALVGHAAFSGAMG